MVTVSNPRGEAAREGSPPELLSAEEPTRRGAQRANSITRTDSVAFQAVTQSARALFRGGVSALDAVDRAGSLPAAEWVTASPARSAVALAVFSAFWLGR